MIHKTYCRQPLRFFGGIRGRLTPTRRRVYCEEMGLTAPEEFTDVDPTSRHVLIQSEQRSNWQSSAVLVSTVGGCGRR